jgi:AhpD family alkylhydroperoxidase
MTPRLDYAAAAPEGMTALAGVRAYVEGCGLERSLVELVYLRASQINGCAYCVDLHSRALLSQGVAIGKLALIPVWREAGALFSDREKAALAWAESTTRVAETGIPEADFATAGAQFTQKELVDLTIAIGLMNAYNRIAVGFRAVPAAARDG